MFQKLTVHGWVDISIEPLLEKLGTHVDRCHTTIAMIILSGELGYHVTAVGQRFRWVKKTMMGCASNPIEKTDQFSHTVNLRPFPRLAIGI